MRDERTSSTSARLVGEQDNKAVSATAYVRAHRKYECCSRPVWRAETTSPVITLKCRMCRTSFPGAEGCYEPPKRLH